MMGSPINFTLRHSRGIAFLLLLQSGCHDNLSITFSPGQVRFPICEQDGQTNCITSADYLAVQSQNLATKIPAGKVLAGIKGTATAETAARCSADGQQNCKSTMAFLPADANNLAGKIIQDQTVAGIVGLAPKPPRNCIDDGDSDCLVSGSNKKSVPTILVTAEHLKSGIQLAGVLGTVISSPADCASDGEMNCVATAAYPGILLSTLNPATYADSLSIGGQLGQIPSCSADGQSSCIMDDLNFKAVLMSNFTAGDIRFGKTLGGVAGTLTGIPSSCASTGDTLCLTSNLFPAVDVSGHIHANLVKIHSSITLFGETGTLLDCSSDAGIDCFSTNSFPSIDLLKVQNNTGKFRDSLTIAGVPGTLANCAVDGGQSCFVDGSLYKAALLSSFNAGDIRSSVTIAGVSGSGIPAPANCSSDGQTSCVAGANFPAVDKIGVIQPAVASFHTSLTLGGVSGTLGDCSSDNQASCLTTAIYPAVDKVAKAIASHYLPNLAIAGVTGTIGSCAANGDGSCYTDGSQYKAVLLSSIDSSRFLVSQSVASTSGSIAACAGSSSQSCQVTGGYYGAAVCLSNGSQSCQATSNYYAAKNCAANSSNCYLPSYVASSQPLKAISYDSIFPGIIKSGSVIGGVTGNFPSSSYPLTGADIYAEFTSFSTQLSSNSSFGWFDRYGSRYTGSGDANLISSNVLNGVDVLGTIGNQVIPSDPWDVRANVEYGSSGALGAMKYNCRNSINNSIYNYDGLVSGLTNSGTTAGTTFDIWDTIDDYSGFPASTNVPASWDSSLHYCGGYSKVASDSNVWLDTTPGNCNATFCMFKDKISGRTWSKRIASSQSWAQSVTACNDLADGGGGWRLPTQKEAVDAYIHGIASISDGNFLSGTDEYWSATNRGAGNIGSDAIYYNLAGLSFDTGAAAKTNGKSVLCIK